MAIAAASPMHSIVIFSVAAAALFMVLRRKTGRSSVTGRQPPVIVLPDALLFQQPRKAYEDALQKYGSIVGVVRKDRLEYIVDASLTVEVLTNDSLFSFEKGTLTALNLKPLIYLPHSFISSIDELVHDALMPSSLDSIIVRVAPIFESRIASVTEALNSADVNPIDVDIRSLVHSIMAESMIQILLGKNFVTAKNVTAVEKVAMDIATISGIYQNLHWWSRKFPAIWRFVTWARIVGFSLPCNFVLGIGWTTFVELNKSDDHCKLDRNSLIYTWSRRYKDLQSSKISFVNRAWALFLLLGLIFASVHQSAVVMIWVLFELSKRPEELLAIRSESRFLQEVDEPTGNLVWTAASLKHAERLDSFIREVMRLKGDTLSTVRQTTEDVHIGGYILPKDSLVIPLATLSHESEEFHGEDAKEFVGDRWLATGKPAVKVGPGYWPFGMGRWACPGRALAIAEIKLLVLSVIFRATPSLSGNEYKIIDPMNTTSVPPQGKFMLSYYPAAGIAHEGDYSKRM